MKLSNSSFFENTTPETNQTKEYLKKGGTCNIFRVRIDRKYYIRKELILEYTNHPVYKHSFNKEFEIGQELEHPNIVKYLYFGSDHYGDFIIQEYIDGKTLTEIKSTFQNLSFEERLKTFLPYLRQITDGLTYLHRKGITHGDLKPDNILITNGGNQIKIVDFGHSHTSNFVYTSGGTKNYYSENETDYIQKDIYSLSIITEEIIGFGKPFHLLQAIIDNAKSGKYKTVQEFLLNIEQLSKNEKRTWIVASVLGVMMLGVVSIWMFFSGKEKTIDKPNTFPPKVKTNPTVSVQDSTRFTKHSNRIITQDYEAGFAFYKTFSDTLQKIKPSSSQEINAIKNDIIVSKYKQWENTLAENNVRKGSSEYVRKQKEFNKGYFYGWQKSDSLISTMEY